MALTRLKSPNNTYLITDEGDEGFFTVENASTNVHQFELDNMPVKIAVVHVVRRQDLSLRAWISDVPSGLPFYKIPETDRFVHLPRRSYIWVFYPKGTEAPIDKGIQNIELDKGIYYLNIQNTENARNGYRLFIIPILSSGDPNEVKC